MVHCSVSPEGVHPRSHVCILVVKTDAEGREGEVPVEEPNAVQKMARVRISARPERHKLWVRIWHRVGELSLSSPTAETFRLVLKVLGLTVSAVVALLQAMGSVGDVGVDEIEWVDDIAHG